MLKCPECGKMSEHAKFCSECGHHFDDAVDQVAGSDEVDATQPIAAAGTPAEPVASAPAPAPAPAPTFPPTPAPVVAPAAAPAASVSATSPTGERKRMSRGVLFGGAIAALIVIGGAAFLFMGAAESQEEKDYKEKLAKAMGPVLGANEQLSEEVDDVEGSDVSDAKSAVKKLKREITRADGAIGSLEVPADLEQLRRDARNVLSREERYVAAIEEVLANPSSPKADDLEDREADLVDALDNAGPTVAGEDEVVFGIDNLEDWAPKLVKARAKIAAAKKAKAAAAKKKREEAQQAAQTAGTTVAPSTTPRWAVPAANGKDCGGGLYAGANTTCAFSEVVRSAYNFAPTTVANVDAYSPVTQRTYSMYCRPSGDWILCTGGNNASVWF